MVVWKAVIEFFLGRWQAKKHQMNSDKPVVIRIVGKEEYWKLREPYDRYLPDSVPAEEVEAELDLIEKRFREDAAVLGEEEETWAFPGHYQHVRVFYVYVNKPVAVCPSLAMAVQRAMSGFEDRWIGEFECYEKAGGAGDMSIPLYLHGEFVFEDDALSKRFAAALQARG